MTCLGQKPTVEIIEGQNLVFDRILINQQMSKQIKIQNISAIPVKWRLKDVESLP